MKKLLKDVDKKLVSVVLMIILLFTTFVAYKVYAVEVTDEMESEGNGLGNGVVGTKGYLTSNDLINRYDIFCCSKGTPLPGPSSATLITEEGSAGPDVTSTLKPGDEGKQLFRVTKEGEDTETPFQQGTYSHRTYGEYEVKEVKVCTPMEAYILAEMINNVPNCTNAGMKFKGDESGHKIEYTGSIDSADYMVIGDKTVYIIHGEGTGTETLVMQDTDGKYYEVEEDEDQGLGVYSYVQRAWWNTEAVTDSSNDVAPNGLTEEAKAFEEYIARFGSTDPSTFVDQEFEINGVKGVVPAPVLKYEPKYHNNESYEAKKKSSNSNSDSDSSTVNLDNLEVTWEGDICKVGPFSIDYIEAGCSGIKGRSAIQFAGITDANLYTDASNEPLVRGTDWGFVWLEGERSKDDTTEFPHEDEVFYIYVKDMENLTQIKNLSFDFKYMNAGGKYEKLCGTYYDVTWEAKEEEKWCTSGSEDDPCSHGNTSSHIVSTDYWVELASFSAPMESQQLAGGLIAGRWYKTAHLDKEMGIHYGKLAVKKILVNEKGEPVQPDSKIYFYARVTVEGAINSRSTKFKIRAGTGVDCGTFYWLDSSAVPTFKVEEFDIPEGYKLVDIKPSEGSLIDGKTATVEIRNTFDKPHEASLQIDKEIEKLIIAEDETILDGTFNFKVILKGTFEYAGEKIKEGTKEIDATITTSGGKGSWTLPEKVKWYGEKAPGYEVKELESDNFEVVKIDPSQGTFDPDKTEPLKVTAINKSKIEGGYIHIIKELEHPELFSEEKLKTQKFKFNIKVDGYPEIPVEISPIRKGGKYIWEYKSPKFEWKVGKNPNFEIKEIEVPKGMEFKDATSTIPITVDVANAKISGKLVLPEGNDTGNIDFFIKNGPDGNPNEATLHITKIIHDEKLKNKDYKFAVTVKGTFIYQGTTYVDKMVQITNDKTAIELPDENYDETKLVIIHIDESGSNKDWSSDKFTWYGDAPAYKIEECLKGEDIVSTINRKEGFLDDADPTSKKLEIQADNYPQPGPSEKVGKLKIIKLLVDENGHVFETKEDFAKLDPEFIKTLVFKFKVHVDGVDHDEIVTLSPDLKGDIYVWEGECGPYIWKDTDPTPKYTVEEIEESIPKGTQFHRAYPADNVPGGSASGRVVSGELIPTDATEEKVVTTDNYFENKVDHHGNPDEGLLTIKKEVMHDSLKGKEFKFNVTLEGVFSYKGGEYKYQKIEEKDVVVNGGEETVIDQIAWYGTLGPKYNIEEIPSDIAEIESISNASGRITADNPTAEIKAINKPIPVDGYIEITKTLANDVPFNDETYYFDVTIGNEPTFTIGIKPGQTVTIHRRWYKSETPPEYHIKEKENKNVEKVEIDKPDGQFSEDGEAVHVVATNTIKEKHGSFKVKKEIVADEKLLDANSIPKFDIVMKVTGTFMVDGEKITNGTKTYTAQLGKDETFESPEFTWWGDEAPTVDVTEENIPKGWKLVGISNNHSALIENEAVEIFVTNKLPSIIIIDVTMELGGEVWIDEPLNESDKNTGNDTVNGLRDEAEKGVSGVEVYVYDGTGALAKIYDETGTEMSQPRITDDSGHWRVPAVKPSKGPFYVDFIYEGQTYEPTKSLVTGPAEAYKSASTVDRDAWARDSMAVDVDRNEVNSRLEKVIGKLPIDGTGNTVGSSSSGADLFYEGTYNTGANRINSKLITVDGNDRVYDVFKARASTQPLGLLYPFDDKIHLESYDTEITELGLVSYYKYSATYNYVKHINLGLVERPKADVEAVKDLRSANVVVNDRLMTYKFNTINDIGVEVLTRRGEIDSMKTKYQLGLYTTDYYYRADLYRAATNAEGYDALEEFYKTIYPNIDLNGTELEVYLQYKIDIYNQSPIYKLKVDTIDDYFDTSFGKPIDTKVEKNIKKTDSSTEGTTMVTVAEPSKMKINESETPVTWTVTGTGLNGSDGVTYNKMTASGLNIELESGQRAEIFVTFAVKKDTINGVHDSIVLGEKSNIVEVASYSTYYQDGTLAGRVDVDSAPGNINLAEYNKKDHYDDDTDSAPVLDLTLETSNRKLDGIAWEDKKDGEVGKREDSEAVIGGLTTQLVEKVNVNGKDYDFLWPTSEGLSCLGGRSLEYLTGFDSTTETARTPIAADPDAGIEELLVGQYKFNGIPEGDYVVRFIYGNNKLNLSDTEGITGQAQALKADGSSYSGNDNILTANYTAGIENYTAAVFNGQDYKTTIYQTGFAEITDGYVTNAWHDLENIALAEAKVNDARDSEARRIEVMSKSETITNVNGTVLSSANNANGVHTGLYNDYNMFADTAKMKISALSIDDKPISPEGELVKFELVGTVYQNNNAEPVRVAIEKMEYTVPGIDLGLIKRPENNVVLDKQISEIKLITNDSKTIFDAKYNVSYEEVDAGLLGSGINEKVVVAKLTNGKYLVAKVELDSSSVATDLMQSIDKWEDKLVVGDTHNGMKNFRFINIDDEIMQGITINLEYLYTAINVGETDYTSETIENMYDTAKANETLIKDELRHLAATAAEVSKTSVNSVKYGEFIGKYYYTGDPTGDTLVSTRVRQLIDYVDNDAVVTSAANKDKDHSWKNTTITELTGNGYDAEKIIDDVVTQELKLIDKNEVAYATTQRNNLVLSLDNPEDGTDTTNVGFEAKLMPYEEQKAILEADPSATVLPYFSTIKLSTSKTIGVSTDDSLDLTFDNVGEIVKYENTVGRRDELTIPGNVNPKLGEFEEAIYERDSSATELVTFTPPTGLKVEAGMTMQILIVVVAALGILAVGVVIIKKKVLK